jgi:hypothetical protein
VGPVVGLGEGGAESHLYSAARERA